MERLIDANLLIKSMYEDGTFSLSVADRVVNKINALDEISMTLNKAIEIIKTECSKHETCYDCPLHNVRCGCVVETSPYTWEEG